MNEFSLVIVVFSSSSTRKRIIIDRSGQAPFHTLLPRDL